MKNKIKCNACDEEIEEYDKAYEYDNKVYCEHCMTPIQGIVGYNKEWEFDDCVAWTNEDEVNAGTIYFLKDGSYWIGT